MRTEIFKSYSDFLGREDKNVNGVSEEFAELYPNWNEERGNIGCWNCSDCSDCSDCSYCSDCSDCSYCSYCSDCSDCSDCSKCSNCSDCSYCSQRSNYSEVNGGALGANLLTVIPVIDSLHCKVLEKTTVENSLDMSSWHTCDTTHCRAGWVVVLAGEEGKKLEAATSTLFAAMQIYKASSPIRVSPTEFFKSNKEAMIDIERCAKEEMELKK